MKRTKELEEDTADLCTNDIAKEGKKILLETTAKSTLAWNLYAKT
jgi:hypothetical protein